MEALREVAMDLTEGADMVIPKPMSLIHLLKFIVNSRKPTSSG